jgi:hypothetical protein
MGDEKMPFVSAGPPSFPSRFLPSSSRHHLGQIYVGRRREKLLIYRGVNGIEKWQSVSCQQIPLALGELFSLIKRQSPTRDSIKSLMTFHLQLSHHKNHGQKLIVLDLHFMKHLKKNVTYLSPVHHF